MQNSPSATSKETLFKISLPPKFFASDFTDKEAIGFSPFLPKPFLHSNFSHGEQGPLQEIFPAKHALSKAEGAQRRKVK
jgi:hypothetical protein